MWGAKPDNEGNTTPQGMMLSSHKWTHNSARLERPQKAKPLPMAGTPLLTSMDRPITQNVPAKLPTNDNTGVAPYWFMAKLKPLNFQMSINQTAPSSAQTHGCPIIQASTPRFRMTCPTYKNSTAHIPDCRLRGSQTNRALA